MKPHLTYRLAVGAELEHADVPPWTHLISASSFPGSGHPAVDAVFARHGRDVLIAAEYEPASAASWSQEERASGLHRVYRAVATSDTPFPTALIDDLQAVDVVAGAERGRVAAVPLGGSGDRHGPGRGASAWAHEMIGVPEAHRLTQGDEQIVIAVLDTGLDLQHPEVVDRLEPGRDFVDILDGADEFLGDSVGADDTADDPGVGHGTHVAGIIAGGGRAMPRGVVPACRILPVRVLGALRRGERVIGAGLVDNINGGIKWAVDRGASVINMSLGIRHEGGGLPHAEVVNYARRRGVVVVAAAGNDGTQQLYYPGSLPGVVAVGAVDQAGDVASFSTWGDQVDLVAPGVDIYSSFLNGGYAFSSGTSQAAPFVAGATALLRSASLAEGVVLSERQVQHLLTSTADRLDHRFKHPKAGFGLINLPDALRLLHHRLATPPAAHSERRLLGAA